MSQMLIIMLNVVNLLIHFVVKMIKSFVKRFNRLKYLNLNFLHFWELRQADYRHFTRLGILLYSILVQVFEVKNKVKIGLDLIHHQVQEFFQFSQNQDAWLYQTQSFKQQILNCFLKEQIKPF